MHQGGINLFYNDRYFSEMEETKSLLEWIQEIIGKIGLGDS